MTPTNYVLGFVFSEYLAQVLLVRKARPVSMIGKLNGLGGHIEPTDLFIENAMEREAEEEAGITPGALNWHPFGEMSFRRSGARVFLFSARDVTRAEECLCAWTPEQQTEPIEWVDWRAHIEQGRMLSNLKWLIPMAYGCEMGDNEGPAIIQFP